MLAAWNELGAARVRGHLELALAADAVFVDPTIVTRGIAGFEAKERRRSSFGYFFRIPPARHAGSCG